MQSILNDFALGEFRFYVGGDRLLLLWFRVGIFNIHLSGPFEVLCVPEIVEIAAEHGLGVDAFVPKRVAFLQGVKALSTYDFRQVVILANLQIKNYIKNNIN